MYIEPITINPIINKEQEEPINSRDVERERAH